MIRYSDICIDSDDIKVSVSYQYRYFGLNLADFAMKMAKARTSISKNSLKLSQNRL